MSELLEVTLIPAIPEMFGSPLTLLVLWTPSSSPTLMVRCKSRAQVVAYVSRTALVIPIPSSCKSGEG